MNMTLQSQQNTASFTCCLVVPRNIDQVFGDRHYQSELKQLNTVASQLLHLLM